MNLYDMPSNTNSWKIRAVAKELDVRLDIVPINPMKGEQKTEEFLKINPNGKIPALVDGDVKLFESNAILCYLASQYGPTPLLPTDPAGRAQVDQWLFWQSAHLSQAVGKIMFERFYKEMLNLGEPDQKRIEEGMVEVDRYCSVLDGVLARADYVCGKMTVADYALAATFARRDAAQIDLSKYAHVTRWLQAVESRPAWIHSKAE